MLLPVDIFTFLASAFLAVASWIAWRNTRQRMWLYSFAAFLIPLLATPALFLYALDVKMELQKEMGFDVGFPIKKVGIVYGETKRFLMTGLLLLGGISGLKELRRMRAVSEPAATPDALRR